MIQLNNQSPWVVDDFAVFDTLNKYESLKRRFSKGSYIYHQNDLITHLYFLVEGRIKVFISNDDGQEKTLAIHEPGSFFAETAFFDCSPTFSSATALMDSYVIALSKEHVTRLFIENPRFIFYLFASLGRKIRLLTFQVEYLSLMDVEHRFIALILSFFDVFGKPCPYSQNADKQCSYSGKCESGIALSNAITDQEIGEMLGIRREAVTKAIVKLRKLKLLHKKSRILCCPSISAITEYLKSTTKV